MKEVKEVEVEEVKMSSAVGRHSDQPTRLQESYFGERRTDSDHWTRQRRISSIDDEDHTRTPVDPTLLMMGIGRRK